MTPRQTVTMVVASVVLPGLAGGALGVPLGMTVHRVVIPAKGRAAGLRLPDVVVLGALLPAGWAARVRTATALRAE